MSAEKVYTVYILASGRHGTLYIGVTNNLRTRLEQHRAGHGSEFVKKYGVYRASSTSKNFRRRKRRSSARNS
jgi:predicted GIY-YIG superfamily endonuclease